jgi:hypothetical protein
MLSDKMYLMYYLDIKGDRVYTMSKVKLQYLVNDVSLQSLICGKPSNNSIVKLSLSMLLYYFVNCCVSFLVFWA